MYGAKTGDALTIECHWNEATGNPEKFFSVVWEVLKLRCFSDAIMMTSMGLL